MKFASFFFTILISSLALAISVHDGDKGINTPTPTMAHTDKDIRAADTAASMIKDDDDIDHPHHHDRRDQPRDAVVSSPPQPLRLGRKITTITITTYKDDPYTYYGMPTALKAGTYTFKYVNKSSKYYSFMINGGDGWYATPLCAYCTKSVTLQVDEYYNIDTGEWEPWALYFFYPYIDAVKYVTISG